MTELSVSKNSEEFNDSLARLNAFVLAGANALSGGAKTVVFAVGGLAGYELLSESKIYATLPITIFIIGTTLGTMPAALLMRRIGRRLGFQFGALLGVIGGFIAGYAILIGSMTLFCSAMILIGVKAAFSQQYRFAAADTASKNFRPKAIAYVLFGGVLAGVIGPQTVIYTTDLFAPILFAGCFFGLAGLSFSAFVLLSFVNVPKLTIAQRKNGGRPLLAIMKTKTFVVSSVCGTLTYSMMTFIMTATPLAMVACGLTQTDAALGIQWHVLAMFGPSFFTGNLIIKYGSSRIMSIGLILIALSGVVALSGITLMHFWSALVLLGLGWNFGFIGATTMLTDCYQPEERNKVQGANELLVFGFVAIASFISGSLLHNSGWELINILLFPVVIICLLLLGWHAIFTRRAKFA